MSIFKVTKILEVLSGVSSSTKKTKNKQTTILHQKTNLFWVHMLVKSVMFTIFWDLHKLQQEYVLINHYIQCLSCVSIYTESFKSNLQLYFDDDINKHWNVKKINILFWTEVLYYCYCFPSFTQFCCCFSSQHLQLIHSLLFYYKFYCILLLLFISTIWLYTLFNNKIIYWHNLLT